MQKKKKGRKKNIDFAEACLDFAVSSCEHSFAFSVRKQNN